MKSNEITVPQNTKPANISGQIIYQVQPGDSLETIARLQCHCPIYKTNEQYSRKQALYRTTFKNQLKHFTKEKDLMARLVTAEAGGESYKGKVAVAKVI